MDGEVVYRIIPLCWGGGVHILDLMLWLTGDRVIEVCGFGNDIATQDSSFNGDNLRIALLRFSSGMVGKISANFACVYPHHHRLSVYGTEATFENNPEAALLYKTRDPLIQPQEIDTDYPGVAKYALLENFIDAILGRSTPDVTANDVFNCMDVCLKIDEAIFQKEIL